MALVAPWACWWWGLRAFGVVLGGVLLVWAAPANQSGARCDRSAGRRADADPRALSERPAENPSAIKPMIWMHVPKAGSTWETVLVHYACGKRLHPDFEIVNLVKYPPDKSLPKKGCTWLGKPVDWDAFYATTCRWNRMCGGGFGRFGDKHAPLWAVPELRGGKGRGPWAIIPSINDSYLAKVVTVLREPRQLLISSWYFFADMHRERGDTLQSLKRSESACQTQMILGIFCGARTGPEGEWVPELSGLDEGEALRLAVARLRRIGFIGLTDRWALSVCLFHTMYGGECVPVGFKKLRPGPKTTSVGYNLTEHKYDEFREALDLTLYMEAREIFFGNVVKYGVHPAFCRQRCPEAAEQFMVDV